MSFSGPVRAEWLADGTRMRVLERMTYVDPAGRIWTVPVGFVTDGASIPREFWSLIGSPFTGAYRVAAVFHDAAYNSLGAAKDDADRMLHAACIELGCPRLIADVIYEGVRFGGLDAYTQDQREAAAALNADRSQAVAS